MTLRDRFRECMAERRNYKRGSLDWCYLTRAAERYLKMWRDTPIEWRKI